MRVTHIKFNKESLMQKSCSSPKTNEEPLEESKLDGAILMGKILLDIPKTLLKKELLTTGKSVIKIHK